MPTTSFQLISSIFGFLIPQIIVALPLNIPLLFLVILLSIILHLIVTFPPTLLFVNFEKKNNNRKIENERGLEA